MIEREAKLFEAGSYPDRGIEIDEADLDAISANTSDAPIRIEHTDTPFDGAIGVLKSVYRKGRELFGRLCFTAAAWELIKAANAGRLSVAIRKDKSAIAEVSLVREPRVADAAVFSAGEVVRLDGGCVQDAGAVTRAACRAGSAEFDRTIDDLKRAGKLVPASEPFARAILAAGESNTVTFGQDTAAVSEVFLRFLESQPKVIEFAELATAVPGAAAEPDIFARLGVTSHQVEKYRER